MVVDLGGVNRFDRGYIKRRSGLGDVGPWVEGLLGLLFILGIFGLSYKLGSIWFCIVYIV